MDTESTDKRYDRNKFIEFFIVFSIALLSVSIGGNQFLISAYKVLTCGAMSDCTWAANALLSIDL